MMTWSNHDRAAFNEWCLSDLGQKFLRYLEQERPRFEEAANDINTLAFTGATIKGYEKALSVIDACRVVRPGPLPEVKYVNTHTD